MAHASPGGPTTELRDSSPEVDAWFEEAESAKRRQGWRPKGFEIDRDRLLAIGYAIWGVLLSLAVVFVLILGFGVFRSGYYDLVAWWAVALALGAGGAWLAFRLFQEEGDESSDEWAPDSPGDGA